MRIDMEEVFRDKNLLSEIRWEIKRKALTGWKPWAILLPPDLLWPMINEVSQGMAQSWSPFLDGVPIEVGPQNEVGLKFVLPGMKTSPVHYEYVNNDSGDGMVTTFANGIKMVLERDLGNKIWHGSCGVRYEGTEGWVAIADGYSRCEVSNPAWMADFKKLVEDYQARTQRPMSHVRNFFDCIKSRQQTVANPVMMHRSMSTVHVANICMWLKRDMKFDPVKEEFVNDEEANRFRSRAMREPWII